MPSSEDPDLKQLRLFIFILSILAISIPSIAKTVYVSTSGIDTGDGLSWANAKKTVTAGLTASSPGDEIWVAAGTYVECINMKDGVALYGGFAGTEETRAPRNWKTNVTVLDANKGGSVVRIYNCPSISNRIDGFTIQNGSSYYGAGIYISSSSAISIENNIIISNNGSYGGGICCDNSSAAITNNSITRNTGSSHAGGIYITSCSGKTVTISGNTIASNSTLTAGGGIRSLGSNPSIANNLIRGNTASSGGGIWCAETSTIIGNVIIGNAATSAGGGLYFNGLPDSTIINNTIVDNSSPHPSGAVYASYLTANFANNIISSNSSGIYGSNSSLTFQNNCIYSNGGQDFTNITSPIGTNGNISQDPRLAGFEYGNIHINADSPCVDSGVATSLAGTQDIDGQARVQGNGIDVGADEYDGLIPSATPKVVYVRPDGNDSTDGSSWQMAKKTVQCGLVALGQSGGEVWVKSGIYDETITIDAYRYVYGGFDGTETDKTARNWRRNVTVLSSQSSNAIVTFNSGGVNRSCIDGFTIRHTKPVSGSIQGYGINCDNASPLICNNSIEDNYTGINALSRGVPTIVNNVVARSVYRGIDCPGTAKITDNTIVLNMDAAISFVSSGGTIINNIIAFNGWGPMVSTTKPPVYKNNCIFGNVQSNLGTLSSAGNITVDPMFAGLAYGDYHIQPVSQCIDAGDDSIATLSSDLDGNARINEAHVDIGAYESDGTTYPVILPRIVRVSTDGDDANDGSTWALAKRNIQSAIDSISFGAGEIWVKSGTYFGRVTMHSAIDLYGGFSGNETQRAQRNWHANTTVLDGERKDMVVQGSDINIPTCLDGFTITNGKWSLGAAIQCASSVLTIRNNRVVGNMESSVIWCSNSLSLITNNIIAGNQGGIGLTNSGNNACIPSSPTICSNTIIMNEGSGLGISSGVPIIKNNIIAYNSVGVGVGYLAVSPITSNNCIYGNVSSNYSGMTDPTGTNGNISSNPGLVNVVGLDAHIQPDSPCVGAGLDSAVQSDWLDMDGQPRLQGAHVDIGADESDATVWPIPDIQIVRVSPTGNDANDGSTWMLAKKTIQSAIDALSSNGGEAWVNAGIYNERIEMQSGVEIYGGFSGTETERSQRDWKANKTTIDGQSSGACVTASNCLVNVVVDGFTIRNGNSSGIYSTYSSITITNNIIANNVSGSLNTGGGIRCLNCNSVIGNNVIMRNSASQSGGGIFASGSSVIRNNIITENSGESGGGVSGGPLTLLNNYIANNNARGSGGGVSGGPLTLLNNYIVNNNAGSTGGAIASASTSGLIVGNTISGNSASQGNIYLYPTTSASYTMANNLIAFNSSGIKCSSSIVFDFHNNAVYGNTSYNYSGMSDPAGANGNISSDPKVASTRCGDFHIQPDSPCIDAGDDSFVPPINEDLDGQPRIQGAHVDIGADESDGTQWNMLPTIMHVSSRGSDTNDGLTWPTAKKTVQAGIDSISGGGEVWVEAGVYTERITMHPSIDLYGGFAGTESVLADRNRKINITVLDGQNGGATVTAQYMTRGETLDGFTIRNGRPGISLSYSSMRITNNIICGNNNMQGSGGGIYCANGSPTIAYNRITANNASSGGGIYIDTCTGAAIANNSITGNSALDGGGIYTSLYTSCLIANNVISYNGASSAGGGIYNSYSSLNVISNTIGKNSANYGGGIYQIAYTSTPVSNLSNNIIAHNTSGIYKSKNGSMNLNYNCVYGNASYNYSGVTDPSGTNGNIAVNPAFASTQYGDLHIQPNSPCIDAGDDILAQSISQDIDDQPRVQGAHVDIGADESDGMEWSILPTTMHVSPNGNDMDDGLTWETAKKTVQAGLNSIIGGGEVWVAAGVYKECIFMRPIISLYGGFVGTESALSERDPKTNLTVLDGQKAGNVVSALALNDNETIDGFVIRNGIIGVYVNNSAISVNNNTIYNNNSSNCGGGIHWEHGTPSISSNIIKSNYAPNGGGGIYLRSCTSGLITGNVISGNNGNAYGGGIYVSSAMVYMINNTILRNIAYSGGGIQYYGNSTAGKLIDNIVAFNSSGVYIESGTLTVSNNCAYGNIAYNYNGITDPMGTNVNISVDPMFTRVKYGDFHIQTTSPCIDAGDDTSIQALSEDIDGQSRIQGAHVDIGADESDGTEWNISPIVMYVRTDGNDSNDGSSWELAKKTVQAGIDALQPTVGEVWVAAGVYNEHITMRSDIDLYGGYAGNETSRSQRDCKANVTILDGENSGTVVTASNLMNNETIDGFTIRNGSTCGVISNNSNFSIVNNIISDNGTTQTDSGGICCNGGAPNIVRNTITANKSIDAVIYMYGYSYATISGNNITANDGGLFIYTYNPSLLLIENNMIAQNAAASGSGGIEICASSSAASVNIINNTVARNNSDPNSGSIQYTGSSAIINLSNNIVAFNSSGITNGDGTLNLSNNCVYGNTGYNYKYLTDPTGTNGNISVDPGFAEMYRMGNFHLQSYSPCVDAGLDSVPLDMDIDGQPRLQGAHIDIGADESDGSDWNLIRNVVHVTPYGDDANDGSSWQLAKKTVQAAINVAGAVSGGADVWVSSGVYVGQVTMRPFVDIYGGFIGNETDRAQRNSRENSTILDGQQSGTVVTASQLNTKETIDGFIIINGANSGIYCESTNAFITNNIITNNTASIYGGNGGGINCINASPTISGNTITKNYATFAGYGGGGISIEGGTPVITNNLISSNVSSIGGGIRYFASSPTITNNVIDANSAGSNGGGICSSYCYYTPLPYYGSSYASTIVNNTIVRNSSPCGGGIYIDGFYYSRAADTIGNNIVAENSSGIICDIVYYMPPQILSNCVYGNGDYNYSSIADPTGTNGNLSVDPKVVLASTGIVHLQQGSPCINTGNDALGQSISIDIDGQPRIQDTHIDIGADESDGSTIPASTPIILYVSPDGNDANDGLSWNDAKKTVQAGIDTASAQGCEVWVKAGIYRQSISLSSNVYLYGGFDGTETSRAQRNNKQNETILEPSANNSGSSIVSAINSGYMLSGIDGFTIRNGLTCDAKGIDCGGSAIRIANNKIYGNAGGIKTDGPSAIISNLISGNVSVNTSGGIYSNGASIIANNIITNNSGAIGGIYCYGSAIIQNNTIVSNYGQFGGAILANFGTPNIANNIIAYNSSGEIISPSSASFVFKNNCVYANTGYGYSEMLCLTGMYGNISVDPKFASLEYGNLHIQPDSLCRDAGDSSMAYGGQDIDGENRIIGSMVDIGADESAGEKWDIVQNIVRVSPDGNDANDGSTWDLAKKTIQSSIDALISTGGEVWASAGTYSAVNPSSSISLKPYVYLYGGFAGIETVRSQRDCMANPTIINGQQSGTVISASNMGYRVSTVDGFIITNGRDSVSGGISCNNASPTITSNLVRSNASTDERAGSGLYCYNSGPFVVSNVFTFNNAPNGGTVCLNMSSPLFANNTIVENAGNGIGIYSYYNGIIFNNIVASNSANGIYIEPSGYTPSVPNYNCVYGNTAGNYSGIAAGNNDISANPMLISPADGDCHLADKSPCKDAGDPNSDYTGWKDIDGGPRVSGPSVDIGADEWGYNISGSINLGAYNGDLSLWPITIRLQQNGDDQRADTVFISDNPGEFNLKNVYPGTYDITFERTPHWLRRTIKGVHVGP